MTVRLCGIGDNLVDRYVNEGLMFPGGNAVNVAVHARRSGADTAYVGVIGTDHQGDFVKSSLILEGVHVDRLHRLKGETAFATVYLDPSGNRSFGLCEKGVSIFHPYGSDVEYLAKFDVVHLCETSQLEEALPAIAERTAVSFDFSDRDNEYAALHLPWVTVATFSRSESSTEDIEAQIEWAHAHGARWVIVTRGAKGAVISDGINVHHQEAAPANVVDTLGSGDSFIARLVVRLWEGVDLVDASEQAALYAAEVCSTLGGFGYGRELIFSNDVASYNDLMNEGSQ
jgi:fructoselysine 6-kinase